MDLLLDINNKKNGTIKATANSLLTMDGLFKMKNGCTPETPELYIADLARINASSTKTS